MPSPRHPDGGIEAGGAGFRRLAVYFAVLLLSLVSLSCERTRTADGLPPAWKLVIPQKHIYGQDIELASSDGLVFCLAADSATYSEASLYAIDGETGRVVWSQGIKTKGIAEGLTPLIRASDGLVIYQTESGSLRALDSRTGAERWQVPNVPWVLATAGGRVHVFDGEWQYVVLDARTGDTLKATGIHGNVMSKLEVADGYRYLFNQHVLTATDAENEKDVWTYRPKEPSSGFAMRFRDGVLYVVADNNLIAFEARTGNILWQTPYSGVPPAVERGVAYLGKNDDGGSGNVLKRDAVTGRDLGVVNAHIQFASDYALDVEGGMIYSSAFKPHYRFYNLARHFYDDERAGSYDYVVKAVDATDGRPLWSTETVWGEYVTKPAVVGNSVHVGVSNYEFNGSSLLVCYSLKDVHH